MNDLVKFLNRANFVYICGNGGSASNAEHFTNDLFKKGVKAVCLNSNVSLITMIANDYGYEHIFSKQIDLFGKENDLLITISCSGTSPNIVMAKKAANLIDMDIYSFPTFKTKGKHSFKEYGLLEDEHSQLIHRITSSL